MVEIGIIHGPNTAPEGWTDLSFAVQMFFMEVVKDPTIGLHISGISKTMEGGGIPPLVRLLPENNHHMDAVDLRRLLVYPMLKCLSSAIMNGKVKAGYCHKGGGFPKDMPREWWRTDAPFLRYQGWGVDPESPFIQKEEYPAYVFLESESLGNFLDDIKHWIEGLPLVETEDDFIDLTTDELGSTVALWSANIVRWKIPLRVIDTDGVWFVAFPVFPTFTNLELVTTQPEEAPPNSVVALSPAEVSVIEESIAVTAPVAVLVEGAPRKATKKEFSAWIKGLPQCLAEKASMGWLQTAFKNEYPSLEVTDYLARKLLSGRDVANKRPTNDDKQKWQGWLDNHMASQKAI